VQLLWAQATKDFERAGELYQQIEMQRALDDLEAMIAAGQIGQRDLFNTRRTISRFNLTPAEQAALNTTMEALEGVGIILNAIGTARPGGGAAPVPPGIVEVIYTPSMPQGQVANLGNGYWLVGVGPQVDLSIGRTNIAGAMGYPVYDPGALCPIGGEPVEGGVMVYNPKKTKAAVKYSLNGAHSYTMQSGQSQALPGGTTWKIKFHRGGEYGESEYALSEGGYRFAITDKGWELYRETYKVTIDNSAGRTEFNFVSDNQSGKIAPGQKVEITSEYPIAVSYDRGDGTKVTSELDNNSEAYVGLAADTSLWGLFHSNQAAAY